MAEGLCKRDCGAELVKLDHVRALRNEALFWTFSSGSKNRVCAIMLGATPTVVLGSADATACYLRQTSAFPSAARTKRREWWRTSSYAAAYERAMCTRYVGRHVPNKNGPTGRRQVRAAGQAGECRGAWSCARYLETDKVDITDKCEGKRAERSGAECFSVPDFACCCDCAHSGSTPAPRGALKCSCEVCISAPRCH